VHVEFVDDIDRRHGSPAAATTARAARPAATIARIERRRVEIVEHRLSVSTTCHDGCRR
jgi:hypothetical protein